MTTSRHLLVVEILVFFCEFLAYSTLTIISDDSVLTISLLHHPFSKLRANYYVLKFRIKQGWSAILFPSIFDYLLFCYCFPISEKAIAVWFLYHFRKKNDWFDNIEEKNADALTEKESHKSIIRPLTKSQLWWKTFTETEIFVFPR